MVGQSFVIPELVAAPKKTHVTAAQIIFFRYYTIQISGLHLIEEQRLDLFGMVTTGKRQEDLALTSVIRTAQMTIAGMAELLAEGATFMLENAQVASEIYDVIQEHLIDWSRAISNSFNRMQAPLEGLQQLEALAQYIHPHAMRYRRATNTEAQMYRSLQSIISSRGLVRRNQRKAEQLLDQPIPEYSSLTEGMQDELKKRER